MKSVPRVHVHIHAFLAAMENCDPHLSLGATSIVLPQEGKEVISFVFIAIIDHCLNLTTKYVKE